MEICKIQFHLETTGNSSCMDLLRKVRQLIILVNIRLVFLELMVTHGKEAVADLCALAGQCLGDHRYYKEGHCHGVG